MGKRKRYFQSRLECYLGNKVQQILTFEYRKNPYHKINCSLLSEINVSESYSYFRCDYREGMAYPKTGSCFSCPLRNLEGVWIGADVDLKNRREYLKSQINFQWLCFGIK